MDKDSEIFRGEGKLSLDKDSESSGSDVGAGAVWGSFVVKGTTEDGHGTKEVSRRGDYYNFCA